jgi:hypothetical protein
MMLAQDKIACPPMTEPARGRAPVLTRGWTFFTRLLVATQGSPRAETDMFKRYESCCWCDSIERQLNADIMFGRSTRF